MPQATPNKGAGPQTQKAFPDPEIPEGIDNGEETGDDTIHARPLSPRDEMLARIEANSDASRLHEMEDVPDKEGTDKKAHQQDGAVPEQSQSVPANPEGATDDPLANYITLKDGTPMLRMKVDGVERLVPLESARASLQKGVAGDARLQEAANRNKTLDERESRIRQQEAELAAALQQKNSTPSVTADVSDQGLKNEVHQVVSSLFTGTEDEAVEKLTQLIGRNRQASQAPVDVNQIAAQAAAVARKQFNDERAAESAAQQAREISEGFDAFQTEFADIVTDPGLFRVADGLTDQIAAENPSWSPKQVMSEAGRKTREWVDSLKGGVAPPTLGNEPDDRQNRKRNLTPMPRPSAAKAQQATSVDAPETPQSVVAQMRSARGQG